MNNLFMPKEIEKERFFGIKRNLDYPFDDCVLVYGEGKEVSFVEDFHTNPQCLDIRDSAIRAFCIHGDTLVDAGDYGICVDTLEGDNIFDVSISAEGTDKINSLCSYEGKLYSGGHSTFFNLDMRCGTSTETNATGNISSVCSRPDGLYFSEYNQISHLYELHYDLGKDSEGERKSRHMTSNKNPFYLCYHRNTLYHGVGDSIVETILNDRYLKVSHGVRGLFSHNDSLYTIDSRGKIFDPFEDKLVFDTGGMINAAISVPRKMLEEFLPEGEVEF